MAGLVFVVSLAYYWVLAAKNWTWAFVSMDSGDWLSAVLYDMTPHPYGSPIYILLGKLLNILPFDIVDSMTIGLSVIPAAVTVTLVYLIVKRYSPKSALITAGVVLGSAVLLTQATVLESYSLTVMLITAAIYFYDRKKMWLLCLGLATGIHVIAGIITLIWLVIDWRKWREWLPATWIFVLAGLVPYLHTLWTMTLDTPKLFGGGLSFDGIMAYLGGTDRIGTMAVVDAPQRLFQFASVLLASLGLAIIPLIKGYQARRELAIGTITTSIILLSIFLYITNLDSTTWTYLLFGLPFMAVYIGHGLAKMTVVQVKAVAVGALLLLNVNAFYLNANTQEPLAMEYYAAIRALPDGAAVLIPSGSTTGSGFYYAGDGKGLIPIITNAHTHNVNYDTYIEQVNRLYPISGDTTLELAYSALEQGIPLYFAGIVNPLWLKAFEISGDGPVYRVLSVNLNPEWTEDEIQTYG